MEYLLSFSTLENILFSLLILVVMGSLIFIFYKLIVKESKRYRKDKLSAIGDVASIEDLKSLIEYRMSKDNQVYFALCCISIDRLDMVREHIHSDGVNKYLKKVSQYIRMNLPRGAKMAQMPQKEMFLVYIPELIPQDQLYDAAYKLKQAAERRIAISGDIHVNRTATVAAVSYPEGGDVLETLLHNLRSALVFGLRNGGNSVTLFGHQTKASKDNLEQYFKLKQAFEQSQIHISFLPICQTESQKCYGMQAKVSYKDSTQGSLGYQSILSDAQKSGDAFWVGQRLAELAARQGMDAFNALRDKEYYMILTVATAQLENQDTAAFLDATIKKLNADSNKVVLNIMGDNACSQVNVVRSLISLKNSGFKLCFDADDDLIKDVVASVEFDFCLIDTGQITKAKNNDKYTIIAKNVANSEQIDTLSASGVPFMQGPYFGLALLRDELLPYVTKNRL